MNVRNALLKESRVERNQRLKIGNIQIGSSCIVSPGIERHLTQTFPEIVGVIQVL